MNFKFCKDINYVLLSYVDKKLTCKGHRLGYVRDAHLHFGTHQYIRKLKKIARPLTSRNTQA